MHGLDNYVWGAFLFCLPLCWLVGFAVGQADRRGRGRRRGGFVLISPSVSGSASPTTEPTLELVGTSTGCRTAGTQPEVTGSPVKPAGPSRTIARGSSGAALAIRLGDRTTGAPGGEVA